MPVGIDRGLAEHVGRLLRRLLLEQLGVLLAQAGDFRRVLGDVGGEPVAQRALVLGGQFPDLLVGDGARGMGRQRAVQRLLSQVVRLEGLRVERRARAAE